MENLGLGPYRVVCFDGQGASQKLGTGIVVGNKLFEPQHQVGDTPSRGSSLQLIWSARISNSAARFVAPIMLVGRTALSVEIVTKVLDPVLYRSTGNVPGSKDIRFGRCKDVLFHHRNLLVGRRLI